jgi:hypothetical protein
MAIEGWKEETLMNACYSSIKNAGKLKPRRGMKWMAFVAVVRVCERFRLSVRYQQGEEHLEFEVFAGERGPMAPMAGGWNRPFGSTFG